MEEACPLSFLEDTGVLEAALTFQRSWSGFYDRNGRCQASDGKLRKAEGSVGAGKAGSFSVS